MRIVLSVLVVLAWAKMMLGNLVAAGRTAGEMQMWTGITQREAQHRTTLLVIAWAIVLTVAAAIALFLIWRVF